jgi:hypothetical protein
LDDKKFILAGTCNAADEQENTESSDSDTEKAFLKVTHSEGKEALETALHYVQQQKVSTPGDVTMQQVRGHPCSEGKLTKSFKYKLTSSLSNECL